MSSELARLDERLVTAGMCASVGPFAGVNSLMGLERFFTRESSLAETTPDWTLRLSSFSDERHDFL